MFFAAQTLSGNLVAYQATVSPTVMFTLLFAIVILLFVFAIVKQTLIMYGLSTLGWFGFAIALYIGGDPESGLTQGLSIFSFLFGFIMIILMIAEAFSLLQSQIEEKKRRIAEDIM